MPPKPVRPRSLYAGVPYDYAAIVPAGRLVFTAGACPLDAAGRVVAPGDFEAQARQALDNLLMTLAAAGSGPAHLLKTTIYVAARDRSDLVRVWNVIAEGLAPAKPPSTLLGVALLGYSGQLVEIEAVAVSRVRSRGARRSAAGRRGG
jgi:enamine deaminase RidA (YjgF/YER057c/UK114 family)